MIVQRELNEQSIILLNIHMSKGLFVSFLVTGLLIAFTMAAPVPQTAGFQIGEVSGYKLLKQSGSSKYYEIDCPQIKDGRPMKLLQLVGTHYEIGFDYGTILGQQILQTYDIFLGGEIPNGPERHVVELFLDWQYDNLIEKKLPSQFKEELRGIQNGGMKNHGVSKLRNLIQRVLVVSSYPSDVTENMVHAMVDAFLQQYLKIHNPKLLNFVENNLFAVVKMIKNFLNKKRIHCSFMAAWGSRTKGGKLYTMRNLDWEPNTGMNKNKIIYIWKIKDTIPHTTIGFPGIIGALTGMSQAGITVHEAGLSSMKETELGFQWTLRLRYIMMHAHNLAEAKQIWKNTENTFGMNHMIASAADVSTGQAPVFVVQTMRDYTAWFADKDPREDGVNFTDPSTKKSFRAGYAMKDVVFRTNHAYDPTINKWVTSHVSEKSDTFVRYLLLKDSFNHYGNNAIGDIEALNITSNVADKGGPSRYHCPTGKDDGINIISALFVPGEERMYAAVEYGSGNNFKTACCGVYLHIDLKQWFARKAEEPIVQSS